MPPNPTFSPLQRRNAAATRLPSVDARARPAGAKAPPVLRGAGASGQMSLPFFTAGARGA